MGEHVKWRGFKELEQNLDLLGAEMKEKGVRLMMSKAAEPMRDDAIRRAPVLKDQDPRRTPGLLRRSIRIWKARTTPYAATYMVGVLRPSSKAVAKGKRKTGKTGAELDPFYWRWIEFGIPSRGIAAMSFLRNAFETMKLESVRVALAEGQKFVAMVAKSFKRTS